MDNDSENVERYVSAVLPTLWSIASRDQRLKVKRLYSDDRFLRAAHTYMQCAEAFLKDPTSARNLISACDKFIGAVRAIYPGKRPAISRETGRAFFELYTATQRLRDVLIYVQARDTNIELTNVPTQRPSPIYTRVDDSKLVLDDRGALHPLLRAEAIVETRNYLQREITTLSETLSTSNIDRRFVFLFSRLTSLINFQDDSGAISFGLHVRAVAELARQIEHELSDVLAIQINSLLTNASYFASQYKDWVDFVRNARDYPARSAVDQIINDAMKGVVVALEEKSDAVDTKIPETMKSITLLLTGTADDRSNAILAGVRGVENVCIAATRYAYEQAILYLKDAGQAARPTLVRLGALAIITVALAVITRFLPVINAAPELNWILENLPKIERIRDILK